MIIEFLVTPTVCQIKGTRAGMELISNWEGQSLMQDGDKERQRGRTSEGGLGKACYY